MSFKKNGTDPTLSRKATLPSPMASAMGAAVAAFVQALLANRGIQPEEVHRYTRSRNKQPRRKPRRNMLTVSKRVRRKHRRAA